MNEHLIEILQRLVAVETKVNILMVLYGAGIVSVVTIGFRKIFNGKKNGGK